MGEASGVADVSGVAEALASGVADVAGVADVTGAAVGVAAGVAVGVAIGVGVAGFTDGLALGPLSHAQPVMQRATSTAIANTRLIILVLRLSFIVYLQVVNDIF